MNSRRRATQRRRVVYVILIIAVVVAGLGLWARRALSMHRVAPADALLLEVLRPGIRLASAIRNEIVPPGQEVARPDDATLGTLPPTVQAYLTQLEQDNVRLTTLLALRDHLPKNAVPAEIIGRAAQPWQAYLLLDKGSAEGVLEQMVVVTPSGVIGQVESCTAHTARVAPLTSPKGGAGAVAQRSGATGVLMYEADGTCAMRNLPANADVKVGDTVVTSGLGGIYPRGFLLGTITAVRDDPGLGERIATVKTAADSSRAVAVVVFKEE